MKVNRVVKLIKMMRNKANPLAWNMGIPIGSGIEDNLSDENILGVTKYLDDAPVPRDNRQITRCRIPKIKRLEG